MDKEVIYLMGDFHPSTLERWTLWAEATNRTTERIPFEELKGKHNPIIIMDDHGLNDLHLPGDTL